MRAKVVATIVLLTLLVIFTIQKTQPVVLNFLSWKISTSFLLYILLGFMIGLLTGYLLIMIFHHCGLACCSSHSLVAFLIF